ncbi:alpha-1,2-mannosyltransferase (Kre5) [Ascosphaera atra]|nr:alpha-1,2-mannosyltransferase (Kre5) [Ascosphaera atra]
MGALTNVASRIPFASRLLRTTAYRPIPLKDKDDDSPSSASDRAPTPSRFSLARIQALLKRRVRIRAASNCSVPLFVVIAFPLVISIIAVVLFLTHPRDTRGRLIPSGTPPPIRTISERYDKVFATGCLEVDNSGPRANAAIVVLARNKELEGVIKSMRSFERHFNRWFNYPYVFLNDGDFDEAFTETVKNHTQSTVEFGKIDSTMWGFPEWMDPEVAREGIRKQGDAALMYGGLESYHHMCRFNSGFFFKHPLVLKYEWYWRLEPDIKYFCDITYDPFIKMIEANKTYGFTIAIKELQETVPNLFRYASAYKRNNNLTSQGMWEMFLERPPSDEAEGPIDPSFERQKKEERKKKEEELRRMGVVPGGLKSGGPPEVDPHDMEGEQYNMCHFWSNFEIARLSWFRSKEYQDFFDMN